MGWVEMRNPSYGSLQGGIDGELLHRFTADELHVFAFDSFGAARVGIKPGTKRPGAY